MADMELKPGIMGTASFQLTFLRIEVEFGQAKVEGTVLILEMLNDWNCIIPGAAVCRTEIQPR